MNSILRHSPARVLGTGLGLGAITFICLVPFFGKAFHIDDPIFLWPAQQILAGNPRPLAAPVNWYGQTSTLAEVTNHFPFVSWLMVPVIAVAGWSEPALHAEFALFAALAIAGMYALAKSIGEHSLVAALLLLTSPAFFVSATTVMSDVPMLCFWIWSIVFWIWAMRDDRPWMFLISSALITAATLSKYPALAIVPLLAVAGTSKRHLLWQIVSLAIPVLVVLGVQAATHHMYGQGIVGVAITYAIGRGNMINALPSELLNGLCFVGGCFPAVPIMWSFSWDRRRAIAAAIAAAVLIAAILFFAPRLIPVESIDQKHLPLINAHAIVFSLLGAASLCMAAIELANIRDRLARLLGLWVLGVFVFASLINWTTNARSVLPMGPALVILALRARRFARPAFFDFRIAAPLGISAMLSLILATADLQIANASRDAANLIQARARTFHHTLWFAGHWGFQWYMQQSGGVPVDYSTSLLRAGDLLVEPRESPNVEPMPPGTTRALDVIDEPVLGWISTINIPFGAAFYSSAAGPLPYVFAPMAPQRFTVYRITQNILPPGTNPPSPPLPTLHPATAARAWDSQSE